MIARIGSICSAAVLIVAATVAFMLAVTSGGVRYPWASTPIIALLAFSFVTCALFVVRLLTAPEPLIPVAILRDPIACCAIAANSFGWGGIIGLNIFLPMYLQRVLGLSATAAGLSLMVLMATLNASAGFSSQLLVRHTPLQDRSPDRARASDRGGGDLGLAGARLQSLGIPDRCSLCWASVSGRWRRYRPRPCRTRLPSISSAPRSAP